MAGCILIDNEKIQVINRSPKYKNKYVHRRTSVSLENLTQKEVIDIKYECTLFISKSQMFIVEFIRILWNRSKRGEDWDWYALV